MLRGFFSACLPYVLKMREDGDWIPLNREYRPLSFGLDTPGQSEAHSEIPAYKVPKTLLQQLDVYGKCPENPVAGDTIHLYHDGNNPANSGKQADWDEYSERLRKLMNCKFVATEPDD